MEIDMFDSNSNLESIAQSFYWCLLNFKITKVCKLRFYSQPNLTSWNDMIKELL